MRSRKFLIFPLAVFLAGFIFASCGDDSDDDSDPGFSELISDGKAYLVAGKGAEAADAFRHAEKIEPDSTDARFGLMLANVMQFTNLLDEVLDIFSEIDFGKSAGLKGDGQTDQFGDILHDFFDVTIAGHIVKNESLYYRLEERGDFRFLLDGYTLKISDLTLVEFGGEFDKADLYFIGALNALIDGIVKIVLAHDLNFDIQDLSLPDTREAESFLETVGPYVNLLENLLASAKYPDFLYLLDDGGAVKMRQAGVDFANAFARLALCFDQVAKETDRQDDDQVRYEDTNNNGSYNEQTDKLFIGTSLSFTPEETAGIKDFARNMATVFYDGSALDENPEEADPLTPATFNGLLTGFGILPYPVGDDPDNPWFYIDALPPWPGVEVGYFFAYPDPEGVRSLLFELIDLFNAIES